MLGKNHIVTNVCTGLCLSTGFIWTQTYDGKFEAQIQTIRGHILDYLKPQLIIPIWVFIPICLLLFLLGTCLPDVDKPNSILGRFLYIPVRHRTWTHAVWIPTAILVVSFTCHILFWIWFGYILHLFWDSLSYCGVCYFYPISNYRYYGKAQVKKKHILKLYRAGQGSEYALVGAVLTITVFVIAKGFINGIYML